MKHVQLENEADALKLAAEELGQLLRDKSIAYGTAHNRQTAIWAAILKQYEEERDGVAGYWIPDALIYHMPRLTRIFDRVMRIVSHPEGDSMGEDPWRDLAGDALAGVVMPKPPAQGNCPEPGCEAAVGHPGAHVRMHAGAIKRWGGEDMDADENRLEVTVPDLQPDPFGFDAEVDVVAECGEKFPTTVGWRICVRPSGHEGHHRCDRGLVDERAAV